MTFIFKDVTLKNQSDLLISIIKEEYPIKSGTSNFVKLTMAHSLTVQEVMTYLKIPEITCDLAPASTDHLTLKLEFILAWTTNEV